MQRIGLALVVALAVLVLWPGPSAVRADAILAPPEACPPGSVGASSHGGTYCEATTCAADSECEDGRVCRERPLCVRLVEVTYNTYRVRDRTETYQVATGPCTAGGACADAPGTGVVVRGMREVGTSQGPARCVTARRCVQPGAEPVPAQAPPEARVDAPPPSQGPAAAPAARPPSAGDAPASPPPAGRGGCTVVGLAPRPAPAATLVAAALRLP